MVRRPLLSEELEALVTGKFSMSVNYDKQGRQHFYVHAEKKNGVNNTKDLKTIVTKLIHESLIAESSEYRETFRMIGDVAKPMVELWDYESEKYFKPGGKQKWVIK